MNKSLVTIDAATAMLANLTAALDEAASVPDLIAVENKLDALHHMVKVARLGVEAVVQITAQRYRTQAAIGQMLREVLPHQGGRPAETVDASTVYRVTLEQLGISKYFSTECQKLADVPTGVREAYIAQAIADIESGEPVELTRKGLFNFAFNVELERRYAEAKATRVDPQAAKEAARQVHPSAAETVSRPAASTTVASSSKIDDTMTSARLDDGEWLLI